MLAWSASALAGPAWRIDSLANTTTAPAGTLDYWVQITNVGDADTDGSEIDVTATLPIGMTAVGTTSIIGGFACSGPGGSAVAGATVVTCQTASVVAAHSGGGLRTFMLTVAVDPAASGLLTSSLQVSGGGAASQATVDPTMITPSPPGFGVDAFDGQVAADAAGNPLTQAGGRPYSASTSIDFNTTTNPNPTIGDLWPVEPPKDILVDLPPGLIVNPVGAARCTASELANTAGVEPQPLCPPASQVGTTFLRLNNIAGPIVLGPLPVFNLVPPPNLPAQFGFNVAGTVITLDGRLRSESDYGLSANIANVSEGLDIAGSTLTFWGVPADSSHDRDRACPGQYAPWRGGPSCSSGAPLSALLRNPTSCTSAGVGLGTTMHMDSWMTPGVFQTATFISHLPPAYPAPPSDWGPQQGPTGCNEVPFEPSLTATPATPAKAGQPDGVDFDVNLPQNSEATGISEADLKKAVVTLPVGVRVSPSAADGLGGCSPAQIGLHSTADSTCPDSSKVGSLTIKTPLLDQELTGSVYLATPHDNPFNSLIAIYLVSKGPGVIVKLPGKVVADPKTGQLTATFDDQPQLPFSNLHLEFFGGPRASLVLPKQCGTYTTHAELTPWSRPNTPVPVDSKFTVSADGNGAPCPPPKFSPGFNAGTVNPVVGAFSPFTLQLQRSNEDQEFQSLSSLSLPPGLLADVGSVSTRCTEVQARAAACPSASHIGTVLTGAGAGPDPFYVPGDVYLMGGFSSGPFKGDPFGLAVIVHALAGPFDLGHVVVETGIQVHDDGSISAQTEPFPTILQGIPLQLKDIRLNLDRPNFILNPTNCSQMAVAGSVVSTEGLVAPVSSRFQVGECAALGFKPSFTVSTAGKTSKVNGASLHVHVGTHEGPSSTGAAGESNIAKVDVQLPVVLPARLPTLQKACTEAQFASDPAGCPVGSFVGTAIAHTPILASPLSGPAILVSHGGQAFPDLVLVLQGEGIRIDLTGHTQIKKGITYNHFETVPDAPVSSFDLTLPQGPHGVLTTDVPGRNLCATTRTVTVTKRVTRRIHGHARKVRVKAKKAVATALLMPTTITAQNGAVIHQNTKIAVTGCPKAKVAKHTAKRNRT